MIEKEPNANDQPTSPIKDPVQPENPATPEPDDPYPVTDPVIDPSPEPEPFPSPPEPIPQFPPDIKYIVE
jgi:hypothetical protein